jgi:hypothetical protein
MSGPATNDDALAGVLAAEAGLRGYDYSRSGRKRRALEIERRVAKLDAPRTGRPCKPQHLLRSRRVYIRVRPGDYTPAMKAALRAARDAYERSQQ